MGTDSRLPSGWAVFRRRKVGFSRSHSPHLMARLYIPPTLNTHHTPGAILTQLTDLSSSKNVCPNSFLFAPSSAHHTLSSLQQLHELCSADMASLKPTSAQSFFAICSAVSRFVRQWTTTCKLSAAAASSSFTASILPEEGLLMTAHSVSSCRGHYAVKLSEMVIGVLCVLPYHSLYHLRILA
eukprot:415316-Rhodomonas_salina.1